MMMSNIFVVGAFEFGGKGITPQCSVELAAIKAKHLQQKSNIPVFRGNLIQRNKTKKQIRKTKKTNVATKKKKKKR